MIDRIDRLALDVDLRLREVWPFAFDFDNDDAWNLETVGVLMRAAYTQGYVDAHTEAVPYLLYRDHAYRLPKRASIG